MFFRYNGVARSLANFTQPFLRNENCFNLEKKLKMPQKTKLLIATLSALCALPAWAENAASSSPMATNLSIVNNYVYRGISKTAGSPAVQGGFDVTDTSGFYIGVWGSNVNWLGNAGIATNSSLELDVYAGVKDNFAADYTYDLGVLRYHYPAVYNVGATSADTNEIYGALGYQWLTVKYSYSSGNAFGVAGSKGSNYLDVSANYPVPDSSVTLGAHYGKQVYKGLTASNLKLAGFDPSYTDYKLSISTDMGGYVFSLAYSQTNTVKGAGYYNVLGRDLGRSATILSFRRTF